MTIKVIAPEPQPNEEFQVETLEGSTLLQAMEGYQDEHKTKFRFKTKLLPTSGNYLVEVNGRPNKEDLFWNTVLYNKSTREAIPIGLQYQPCPGDNVFLRYSAF